MQAHALLVLAFVDDASWISLVMILFICGLIWMYRYCKKDTCWSVLRQEHRRDINLKTYSTVLCIWFALLSPKQNLSMDNKHKEKPGYMALVKWFMTYHV